VAVARYAQALACRVGLSEEESALVHTAALLHDLGKLSFPDRILSGAEPLSEEDWLLIRRHPMEGARVIGEVDGLTAVADLVLAHHERVDGRGYPRGLSGAEVPPLARLMAVADCFDAMTGRDTYRTPLSPAEAVVELERVAGTQLDADFVRPFVELLDSGRPAGARRGRFGLRGRTAEESGGEPARIGVAAVASH